MIPLICIGQEEVTWQESVLAYQREANEHFSNPETSILNPADLKVFEGLEFYPIDQAYRVTATFKRTPDQKPFKMPTSTDRLPLYVKYGELSFSIKGQQLELVIYKSLSSFDDPEYKDYLFLPFTDLTSGDGSYGGGRYLDVRIPEGDTIQLDFNKVYNPYCAYSENYSCPIPPRINDLNIRIEAGVKDFGHH
ncbi:MAG: DUF1684 domain-containing protein [Gilvibacter sp.]